MGRPSSSRYRGELDSRPRGGALCASPLGQLKCPLPLGCGLRQPAGFHQRRRQIQQPIGCHGVEALVERLLHGGRGDPFRFDEPALRRRHAAEPHLRAHRLVGALQRRGETQRTLEVGASLFGVAHDVVEPAALQQHLRLALGVGRQPVQPLRLREGGQRLLAPRLQTLHAAKTQACGRVLRVDLDGLHVRRAGVGASPRGFLGAAQVQPRGRIPGIAFRQATERLCRRVEIPEHERARALQPQPIVLGQPRLVRQDR